MKSAALVFLLLGASFAAAQKLTVTAVSHTATDRGYNLYTPQTTDTNCTSGPPGFPTSNCTSTTTGGTSHVPIHVLTEVVVSDGTQYTLSATFPPAYLTDGDTFPAEIKGNHMFITYYRGGNQGKKKTLKFRIMDIRPAAPKSQ